MTLMMLLADMRESLLMSHCADSFVVREICFSKVFVDESSSMGEGSYYAILKLVTKTKSELEEFAFRDPDTKNCCSKYG
jgi:hypothetical protein